MSRVIADEAIREAILARYPAANVAPAALEAVDALAARVRDLEAENETLEHRADYLRSEINRMRRVLQDADMWDAFCAAYAARHTRPRS